MDKKQFKKEYLTDAFFFVENEEQFNKLQEVAVEFGLLNPIGDKSFIKYNMSKSMKVAKNLTFFPDNRFQKSDFWINGASYGKPKCYNKFLNDYDHIS